MIESDQVKRDASEAVSLLEKAGAEVGDAIRITKGSEIYEGVLIPRPEYLDKAHVTVKLKSGYNIGVRITKNTMIEKIGKGAKPAFSALEKPPQNPDLPRVVILSTGGTIASRVDYRTGAVRSALSASDLYSVVPELAGIARIQTEIVFSLFSENIAPKQWSEIAKKIASYIEEGVDGIVVAHGTDTMAYTAAALSFALQNTPVPIILVGSQRSADRPSSDAATNLIGAVRAAAHAPFAEVAIAFHETSSDTSIALHRGTKARKCHTSRRDAIRSVNMRPLAIVHGKEIIMNPSNYAKRDSSRRLDLHADFDEAVALVKFHPGIAASLVTWYAENGYKGLILEGTGLGHVGENTYKAIKQAVKQGVIVGMASQCIWGRVNMYVYDTGRDLLSMGVIPLEDMLAETALVKLMWIFGHISDPEEAKRLLTTNIAGELAQRTLMETIGRE